MERRRQFLERVGAVSVAVIGTGCTGSQQDGDGGDSGTTSTTQPPAETTASTSETTQQTSGPTEVASGPNGSLVFEPETVEIAVGDTVTWVFESPGHNVSAKPAANEKVKLPDGAEPFASYESDKSYQVVEKGGTYEHTFETAGEYVYVCVPHASSGMVGTVIVVK